MNQKLAKQCVAELIGSFALCFVGILAIKHNPDLLSIALAQGLVVAVMVSAIGTISGGHLNPAVTLGVLISGEIEVLRAVAYIGAQLLGAILAGYLLVNLFSDFGKSSVAAGTPTLGAGVTVLQGLVIEVILTFFLVLVFLGTIIDARGPKLGGLAIGAAVALAILAGGPLTGGALNPARVFGPALASGTWTHHFVYWLGPLLGGAGAGLLYGRWLVKQSE